MASELKTIENLNPVEVFKTNGIDPILKAIREEVSAEVPDVSTDKGRKAIASNAYKVAQSKTLLDKMGKQLADDLNAKLKPINAERKKARDDLDALKNEIRQPLNNWEEEQQRIEAEKAAKIEAEKVAAEIDAAHEVGVLMNDKHDRDMADKLAEERRIEVERIEKNRAEQEIRDAEMKKQAAEQAKIQAEEKAQAALYIAERQRQEAQQQAAQAERDKIAAEERAKAQAEEAEKRAEREKLQAIENERRLNEEEKQRVIDETARREANKRHVGSVRKAAKESLMAHGLDEKTAKLVVMAITNNQIANVSISY